MTLGLIFKLRAQRFSSFSFFFFFKGGECGGKWVLKTRQESCWKWFHVVLNCDHSILWCFQTQLFSTFRNICGCVQVHKDLRHFALIWNLPPMCFLRRYGSTNLASERAHRSGQIVVSVSGTIEKKKILISIKNSRTPWPGSYTLCESPIVSWLCFWTSVVSFGFLIVRY